MFAYFSSYVPHSSAILQGKLPDMINNIEEILAGADIWSDEMETKGIRIFAETLILPLASSTHRVEAMVRECTHAAGTNRGEESRSWYIMLRSVFNTKINEIAFAAREDKVFRGNQHLGPGK